MVDYAFHMVMTDPREEVIDEIPAMVEAGYPTMKLFMAYKGMFFHADDDAILKALYKGKEAGATIMVHAENADMIDVATKKLIAEGKTGPYYHAVSRPPVVEAEATRRAIYLAEMADAPLYVVHVTCKEALEEIKAAYARGQRIFGETCAHYLVLDTEDLAKPDYEGAKYVCSPALRTKEHRDALWEQLTENGSTQSAPITAALTLPFRSIWDTARANPSLTYLTALRVFRTGSTSCGHTEYAKERYQEAGSSTCLPQCRQRSTALRKKAS